jgi:hypothetical protein
MKYSKITAILFSFAGIMSVTGCGGSSSVTQATIGGTLTNYSEVILTNNDSDGLRVSASGNFTFNKKLPAGSPYNVTVLSQPRGAFCTVTNGAGVVDANADNISNISVSCEPAAVAGKHYAVGVTVVGLAPGKSITFIDNLGESLTANDNGLFVFKMNLDANMYPATYSVSVSASPAGQTCTLSNETGNAPSSDFVNVTATCQ